VGITVAHDGSLLVADDGSDSTWRVSYTGSWFPAWRQRDGSAITRQVNPESATVWIASSMSI
jgi:hypothetical protein